MASSACSTFTWWGGGNIEVNNKIKRGLPIKGRAGAVIYHLSVTLHLKVCVTIVTTIIFKLVDGLRRKIFKKERSEQEQAKTKSSFSILQPRQVEGSLCWLCLIRCPTHHSHSPEVPPSHSFLSCPPTAFYLFLSPVSSGSGTLSNYCLSCRSPPFFDSRCPSAPTEVQ